MQTDKLRKAGRSADRQELALDSRRPRRYALAQLLAQWNSRVRRSPEEREWLDGKPKGRELA